MVFINQLRTGVEEVEVDMVKNQVTVKGIVDPQVLCSRIEKKTMRKAKVLSPLPPEDGESAKSEVVVATQVLINFNFLHQHNINIPLFDCSTVHVSKNNSWLRTCM